MPHNTFWEFKWKETLLHLTLDHPFSVILWHFIPTFCDPSFHLCKEVKGQSLGSLKVHV